MAKKILVVDDEPVVVKSLKEILELQKYEVVTAGNGEECIKKILSDKPDLVILDIMMPGMDGYDFLVSMKEMKAIKEDAPEVHEFPDIPIIVVTARGDDLAKDMVGRENIRDYIVKPYDVNDLLVRVKKVLGEK
jgi:CheY-like chemotaxis protein